MDRSEEEIAMRSWRIRIFASTWLCYAGYYFCRKPFYIGKASLGEALSLSAHDLGLIGSVYLVTYTVGQFISGWSGNRVGVRITLLVGMALSIASNVVFGFTDSYATFLTFMALNGLAQSTGWSGCVAAMAPWFGRTERGRVMGFWATNFQAGGVMANALASFVLGHYGYKYSFFAGSAVLLVVWVIVALNQRNKPEDVGLAPVESAPAETTAAGEKASGLSRTTWITVLMLGALYFFVKFIRYALWSWAPYFFQKNFSVGPADSGYLSTIFDLCGIAGVIVAGWCSDKLFKGRRAQISFLFLIGMAGGCLALRAFGSSSALFFSIGIGFVGFMLYGPDALLTGAGAIDIGQGKNAALAAGVINGMGSIGAMVQDVVIGDLYSRSNGDLSPVFLLLLISASMAALIMGLILLRNRAKISDV